MTTDGEILEKLEGLTQDAVRHQLEALRSILQRNGGARYLRPFLGGHTAPVDVVTFRREVPLSSYDDYADHISRMADGFVNGGDPILCLDPLVCFFYSSGTSSMRPKMIPYFDTPLSRAASFIAHQAGAAVLRRLFPPRPSANKSLWFVYADNVSHTKGGFKVMAATAYPLHNNKMSSSQFLSASISPREVILGSDVDCQMYCHLLCGLRHFNVIDSIRAPYAIGLVRAFCLLEEKWEVLCEDIEKGFLSWDTSDTAMKDSINEALGGPHSDLSERIRLICKENSWDGILIKLWPNLRYIKCVTTGSMMHYYPKLKHYAGKVPILGGDYFTSECTVGINLEPTQPPEKTRFIVLPTGAYFEFLTYDSNENSVTDREIVDVSGVEVGKVYEVVVTTYRGFYRYRLGDIVRVTGFYNSSPELEFVMRAPRSSSEIVTERNLISVVEKSQSLLEDVLEGEITEYACSLDLNLSPKQLKIYLEVKGVSFEDKLKDSMTGLTRCCALLEDNFGGIYKVQRERGALRPLLVYIVTPGSFDRLLHMATEKGAPASQYKHPMIIRNREISDFLEGVALATVCSDSKDA
ncbi:probable indole-3-acetic acid-amido synthetase GH3.6 [Rhodamnia argentea]|uniref:Probable indole-3-acetic acid-amido synthetase GH3.6 n=1 Tax=Rhodamnia argentea TaxID=178133 RepID=A0A8B8PDM9_9MYRT|nr:probable indole-3-acetic acid-amido synthetase GH3.6 [Rhodamnia argentea]